MKSAEGRHDSALMRSIRISQLKWRRNFQTTDGWNEWGGGGAHVGALPTFGLLFARPFRRSLPFPLWLQLWREYLFAVFYRTAVAASKKGTRKSSTRTVRHITAEPERLHISYFWSVETNGFQFSRGKSVFLHRHCSNEWKSISPCSRVARFSLNLGETFFSFISVQRRREKRFHPSQ